MDIKPIDININDLGLFTRTAYILDQLNLLENIREIRKLWKLDNNLIPRASFSNWVNQPNYDFELSKEASGYYLQAKDTLSKHDNRKCITEDEKHESYVLGKKLADMNPVEYEVECFMKINGLAPIWKQAILKSVVCGEISEDDFRNSNNELEYSEILNDKKFSWVIEKVYKGTRGKRQILRDRALYWMVFEEEKKGLGAYRKVMDIWDTKCPTPKLEPHEEKCKHCIFDQNIIEQAIHRYRDFLLR